MNSSKRPSPPDVQKLMVGGGVLVYCRWGYTSVTSHFVTFKIAGIFTSKFKIFSRKKAVQNRVKSNSHGLSRNISCNKQITRPARARKF